MAEQGQLGRDLRGGLDLPQQARRSPTRILAPVRAMNETEGREGRSPPRHPPSSLLKVLGSGGGSLIHRKADRAPSVR